MGGIHTLSAAQGEDDVQPECVVNCQQGQQDASECEQELSGSGITVPMHRVYAYTKQHTAA